MSFSTANPARLGRIGAAAMIVSLTLSAIVMPSAQALEPGELVPEQKIAAEEGMNGFASLTVDQANGDILIADIAHDRVFKFDSSGSKLLTIGAPKQQPSLLSGPRATAVDAQGNIFVADTGHHRVVKFDRNGSLLKAWGGKGIGDGLFDFPAGIAVDKFGNVFVADSENDRIQKFDNSGEWLKTWGSFGTGDQQFDYPVRMVMAPNGELAVIDSGNERVKIYDGDGAFLRTWDGSGKNAGSFKDPIDIAVDASNRFYVTDITLQTVRMFTTTGALLADWPRGITSGIAVDSATGRLYVQRTVDADVYVEASRIATLPVITAGPSASATVGKAYVSILHASGVPSVSSFAITAGLLPPGLKLVAGSKVTGVPTKPGSYSVVLQADNGVLAFPQPTKLYAISIGKAPSKISAKLSTKRPRAGTTRIKARIKLSAPYTTGLSKTGKVRVYYGKKRVKTYTVRTSNNGVLKVRLPKFAKRGKTKVTLKYSGNSQLKASKRTIILRVR